MPFDITPAITPILSVWPGDTPLSREVLLDMTKGDNLTLSTLHTTVHLGAHVDGPNHYGADAPAIDERSLDFYIGPCQVIHVDVPRQTRVQPGDLSGPIRAERVLLRTGSYPAELRKLYGDTPANFFGPRALQRMADYEGPPRP